LIGGGIVLNMKVIANFDKPYYFKNGHIYNLEHIYEGGTYKQYLVRGWRGIADYFDAKLFTIIEIPTKHK
jgi:hypothetical protein